ncbi:FMN reductase [Corticibacter populi]|uniref:FMN reductase n=1 Tax=Corticibacter populi TaxID=1550736 RepID=A0A3M6R105_9BURK|nr:FMN reductase [Corticibacter populi]RMX08937.1 FMN reductase [Corticibacter populi]RZS36044.1 FMN reductase [Corticibacter populi]
MSRTLKTVIVNGSLSRPSRTRVLLDTLQEQLAEAVALDIEWVELVDLIPHIGTTLYKSALPDEARRAIDAIESADFLIVGTPVFRGSLPGLLKHLFDLVELQALDGKPVLLAATGGSARHSLVIDHQLRPLFGFFQALTLPIGVYGTPEDIQDGQVSSEALRQRIALTVQLAAPVLHGVQQRLTAAAPQRPHVALEVQAA